jgi:hypothetical protein
MAGLEAHEGGLGEEVVTLHSRNTTYQDKKVVVI